MKKTLLSLLTTSILVSTSFAAGLTTAKSPTYNTQATLMLENTVLSSNALPNAAQEMLDALLNGADFSGQASKNESLIHAAASYTELSFFKRFLEESIARGFKITATDKQGLTLLHRAASNRAADVAIYLTDQRLPTTLTEKYRYNPSDEEIYPLFFAIFSKNVALISTLSHGLTPEQIETTKAQVTAYQEWLNSEEK